jgi:DNA invertase Pin-like site-specific DNA recombinase
MPNGDWAMNESSKVQAEHLRRYAYLYVRQSSLHQVRDNRESTARQYDLKRRAQVLGWSSDQIVVIDDDLGVSGGAATNRDGFQRLVADVGLGRAGLVMGLEVSRLARNSADWHRLLEICALTDTLILDEDGIYDPSHFNDRLLLGLKGTMSEAELHVLRARLIGGQVNKARRGELWIAPPIGYVFDPQGKMIFDPDRQIHETVRLLFETFRRTGSAIRVVRHFREQSILWPSRIHKPGWHGDVTFGSLDHHRVLQMLHNPRYAGAYVYGRSCQRRVCVDRKIRYRRLKQEEWKVFIPDVHPGYITWQEYQANQAKLLENACANGSDRRRSPPREGCALLQGMVVCGICGLRMTVRYTVERGQLVPLYTCQRRGIEKGSRACQLLPGKSIDHAVAELVLNAVTPAAINVAFEVFEELRARRVEADRLRRMQIERLREQAELAGRQYMLVRPENRLVADNLERQWNDRLDELKRAEEEFSRTDKLETQGITPEDRERICALSSDLHRVWNDSRTSARDRKRVLRLLIEDVTLLRDQAIHIHIRWKGGMTSSIERALPAAAPDLFRTPSEIIELVRALALEQTDKQIAQTLNARCLKPSRGRKFNRMSVRHLRQTYAIESYFDLLRKRGWLTTVELAARLGIHISTAKTFAQEGVVKAVHANDRGDLLFELPTGILPKAHPGKRFRDRRSYPKLPSHVKEGVQYEA